MDNATLYANNPQIDAECSNIYIGEVICVDTVSYEYPVYNSTFYDVGHSLRKQGEREADRLVLVCGLLLPAIL